MKKFIMCVVMLAVCSTVSANIDSKSSYEVVYKYRHKKSVRNIIREILNRKQIQKLEKFDIPNTIPIPLYRPLYDIDPNTVKNLA